MVRKFLFGLAVVGVVSPFSLADDSCPNQRNALHTAKKTVSVAHSSKNTSQPSNIVKTAAAAGSFKTLVSLLVAADLTETLQSKGPFTVLAPSDEAFAKVPQETLESLLKPENKEALVSLLSYHVIPNKPSFQYENAESGKKYEFETVAGKRLSISKSKNNFRVNDANILTQNVLCSNGSIQVIDSVLMPPVSSNRIPDVAQKAGGFKTLLAALSASELDSVLNGEGPFTVFAPTDDAFKKLPKGTLDKLLKPENREQLISILKYHVVAGGKSVRELITDGTVETVQSGSVTAGITDGRVTINGSKILKSDITAENGIIHVIDSVLLPTTD